MPFTCDKCHTIFACQQNLDSHMNRKKPCIADNINGQHSCKFCNNVFATNRNMKRHMDSCIVKKNPELLLKCIEKMEHKYKKELASEHVEKIKLIHKKELADIKKVNEYLQKEIDKLKIDIKYNEIESNDIKLTNTESKELIKNENYVYILKEREFIKTDENIYKIGRTKKGHYKRLNQYPKGSVVMALIKVPDAISYESNIKKIFNKTFKQRKNIGSEYFEGDFKIMHKLMVDIILKLSDEYKKEEKIVEKPIKVQSN